MEVRVATPEDAGVFRRLWRLFMEEAYAKGGDLPPTARNRAIFQSLFHLYIQQPYKGVCVVGWEGEKCVGVGLWGEGADAPALEFRHGRTATGWGLYLLPEARGKHLSIEIRLRGVEELKKSGFEAIVGAAALPNKASHDSSLSFGFIPTHTQGLLILDKVPPLYVGGYDQGPEE